MINNFKSVIALFVALLIGFAPVSSHARLASPPPQLTIIFDDMSAFEAAFKSGNWDKARSAAGRIDKTFNQMLPQLKRDLNDNTEKTYSEIINKIKLSTDNKTADITQIHFIELHYFIFSIISKYEYKTPPVLTIINKYIAETEEAIKVGNYTRVVSEMDEIISMFSFVENHMLRTDSMRRDAGDIKGKLKEIRLAGLNKQNDAVKNGISSLKTMLAALLSEIKRTEKL